MSIPKQHYINLANGQFDGTTYDELKSAFAAMQSAENKDKSLVVYFHGGCVSPKAAHGRISGEDGAGPGLLETFSSDNTFPFFFVWETDIISILKNNIGEIFSEEVFQKLLKRIVQFVQAKLTKEGGTRGTTLELPSIKDVSREFKDMDHEPYADMEIGEMYEVDSVEEQQFMETLEADAALQYEFEAIVNGMMTEEEIAQQQGAKSGTVRASKSTLMSPELLTEVKEEADSTEGSRGLITTAKLVKAALFVFKRVIARFINKTDHGIYPTIAEELAREFYLANAGKLLWDKIKGEASDAFGSDDKAYGGTAFIAQLKAAYEAGERRRIVLVGHSAGSIYICQFLQAAQRMGLPEEMKFDVVFLAGAATVDLVAETWEKAGSRIANFRSLALSDEKEQADHLVGFVYPRSLLYVVSGILEKNTDQPLVGMQRYYRNVAPHTPDKNPALKTWLDYLNAVPNRTIWADDDRGPGMATTAKGHTDFDNDLPTLKSLQTILQKGY